LKRCKVLAIAPISVIDSRSCCMEPWWSTCNKLVHLKLSTSNSGHIWCWFDFVCVILGGCRFRRRAVIRWRGSRSGEPKQLRFCWLWIKQSKLCCILYVGPVWFCFFPEKRRLCMVDIFCETHLHA
jgi:hypothetical protein